MLVVAVIHVDAYTFFAFAEATWEKQPRGLFISR